MSFVAIIFYLPWRFSSQRLNTSYSPPNFPGNVPVLKIFLRWSTQKDTRRVGWGGVPAHRYPTSTSCTSLVGRATLPAAPSCPRTHRLALECPNLGHLRPSAPRKPKVIVVWTQFNTFFLPPLSSLPLMACGPTSFSHPFSNTFGWLLYARKVGLQCIGRFSRTEHSSQFHPLPDRVLPRTIPSVTAASASSTASCGP